MRALVTLLVLVGSATSMAADLSSNDATFEALVQERGYPSLVVGANYGNEVVYEKAFGVADRKTGRPATPDLIYRTGSVGKLFTATLLMILRDEGKLHLDDAVQQYLPDGVQLPTSPGGAPAITFRHLATHTSGLPEWPDDNPTVYETTKLESVVEQYRGLTAVELESPIGARFRYSGLGFSLIGHALELAGGDSYDNLLIKKLFAPLGMVDTTINLSDEQRKRLPNHYTGDGTEVTRDAGAPGVRWEWPTSSHLTTVSDLLKFLRMQRNAGGKGDTPVRGSSLTEMHTPQRLQNNWNEAIGIGWWVEPNFELGDVIWHKGGSTGFSSYIAYTRRYDIGVVILTNRYRSVEEIGRAFLIALARTLGPLRSPTTADAENYWNARDWSNAAWAYEALVENSPEDSKAWYRVGSAYHRMRQCSRAVPALQKSIDLQFDGKFYAMYLIARCHAIFGDSTKSLDALENAVKAGFTDDDNELITDTVFDEIRGSPRFELVAKQARPAG